MNILNDSFNKVLKDNEDYESFCEKYKKAHDNLISDLKTFSENLEPQILVPVCSRVFMKGSLIHTNEVMVSLGCGYFTKCTSSDAQLICLRRIQKADKILEGLEKERNFVETKIKFSEDNIFSTDCEEIIEPFDDAYESNWRKEHVNRMKEFRKKENKERGDVNFDEFIKKIELLELQEEIEELHANEENSTKNNVLDTQIAKKKDYAKEIKKTKTLKTEEGGDSREFVLRKKLADLRQRKKTKCNTEEDIFRRLNELEEEEEIEDELDRLYDNIYGAVQEMDTESDGSLDSESISKESEDEHEEQNIKLHNENNAPSRRVSFSKEVECDVKTVSINFSHSDNSVEFNKNTEEITSPADIYAKFPQNLKKETKSIIKNCHRVKEEIHNIDLSAEKLESLEHEEIAIKDVNPTRQIILSNIVEHSENMIEVNSDKNITNHKRPVSKFKSMRTSKQS